MEQFWSFPRASPPPHHPRPALPCPSSHHQTLLAKFLFEHGWSAAIIAAVASSSTSILNSSLAPNFLSNIRNNDREYQDPQCVVKPLLKSVFNPSLCRTTQFAPHLTLGFGDTETHFPSDSDQDEPYNDERKKEWREILGSLNDIKKNKYFAKSIQSLRLSFAQATIFNQLMPSTADFTSLKKIQLSYYNPAYDSICLLNSLPNLTACEIKFISNITGYTASRQKLKMIGQHMKCLTLLDISDDHSMFAHLGPALRELSSSETVRKTLTTLLAGNIHNMSLEALEEIGKLENLTELDVFDMENSNKLNDRAVEQLSNLTKLKKLTIPGGWWKLSDVTLTEHLAKMTELEELKIDGGKKFSNDAYTIFEAAHPRLKKSIRPDETPGPYDW